jgi:hypothetical protein
LAVGVAAAGPPTAARPLVSGAPENDRTIKLDLIDRLESAPEILVLGSSRARRADPTFVRELTERSAFNAGVTGGTAADAWVFTRYVADCFPRQTRRYLWFVDVGLATNGIHPSLEADPRSGKYLDSTRDTEVGGVPCGPGDNRNLSKRYRPDGAYVRSVARNLPQHSPNLRKDVAEAVAEVRVNRGGRVTSDPKRLVWLEKALRFMNRRGERPVIVLNPIHPAIVAELKKHGFPARQVTYRDIGWLKQRYDFVFVDALDIGRWGGSPNGFWDVHHINSANMRRLLTYVVSHSQGALR